MAALLQVKDLSIHYKIRTGWVYAADYVTFDLQRGETLGLVGESGCGKTTTGYGITQLLLLRQYSLMKMYLKMKLEKEWRNFISWWEFL